MNFIEVVCIIGMILRIIFYIMDTTLGDKIMDLLWIIVNLLILIYLKK